MALDPERARDGTRRLDLAGMALAVINGQREQRKLLRFRDRGGRIRIEAATEEYYRSRHCGLRIADCGLRDDEMRSFGGGIIADVESRIEGV